MRQLASAKNVVLPCSSAPASAMRWLGHAAREFTVDQADDRPDDRKLHVRNEVT